MISWIASILSILGIWFNAKKNNWCWPIWIVSNGFWLYIAAERKSLSEFTLWSVFLGSNIWAWKEWVKPKKSNLIELNGRI